MTVQQLINELQQFDSNATVHIGSQPNYPFEYSIDMVTERRDFTSLDDDADSDPDTDPGDVFILEGTQLRYGHSRMWG
jgi:hypothetical protein